MKSLKEQLVTESGPHISNEGIHLLSVLVNMVIKGKIKEKDILDEMSSYSGDVVDMVKKLLKDKNKLEDLTYDLSDASY